MTPNELRIGNWLEMLDGSKFNVSASDIAQIEVLPEYLRPKPITLTPEIMEKCGKDIGGDAFIVGGLFKFQKTLNGYMWAYGFSSAYAVTVKHLHELQNLYYALTGEELKIDL